MEAINFPGVNTIIGKEQPQYRQLPAMRLKDEDGTVITCWQLSDDEIEAIVKNKKFYIKHLTFNVPFQPINPMVDLDGDIEFLKEG
jgi:hypothetical protein